MEQALKVQKVLDPDDKAKVCDLLTVLGEYLNLGGQPHRAFSSELEEAFSLAEAIGDKDRAARACSLAINSLLWHGGGGPGSWITPEAAQWVERGDRYAEPDTPARVWANIGVGELKSMTGFMTRRFDIAREGCQLILRNLELARRINDPEAFCYAAFSRIMHASAPRHARARLDLAEELAKQSFSGISAVPSILKDGGIGLVFLEFGQRQRAERFLDDVKKTAERTGQANMLLFSIWLDGFNATMDGRLEDAIDIAQNIQARGEQLGLVQYGNQVSIFCIFGPLLYMGRLNEIIQNFGSGQLAASPIIRAIIGQEEEAAEILDQWVVARPGIGSTDDETPYYMDGLLLQTALRIGHHRAVELLLKRFAGSGLCTSALWTTCIPRHQGAAAALLGRPEEARMYYSEAIKVTAEMKFRPELALSRLQLAELLLEHYPKEKNAAKEHLDFAIEEFREMKMQPSLDRALQLIDQSSGLE
jgi:tetratricopeptide (TPR) repeat protein